MIEASESDFTDVTNVLGPFDLQHFFLELGIRHQDIQHAEVESGTPDPRLRGRAVLRWWKQNRGREATREALLQALTGCCFVDARDQLEELWSKKGGISAESMQWESSAYEPRGYEQDAPCRPAKRIKAMYVDDPSTSTVEPTNVDVASTSREQNYVREFNIESVRNQLMQGYKETRGKLPLLPGIPEEFAKMDDLFVDLEIIEEDKKPYGVKPRKLESYSELVSLRINQCSESNTAKRILVQGKPGAGKSTTVSKLAYDWACNKYPISAYQLVFAVTINDINSDTDLIGIIQDQLLSEVSENSLRTHIQSHASLVVILFDGYDEASSSFHECEDVQKILSHRWLQEACVIVTTRPNQVAHFSQQYGSYTKVVVNGFSSENREKYIAKFFQVPNEVIDPKLRGPNTMKNLSEQEKKNCRKFIKFSNLLKRAIQLHQLCAIPIILSMLCLIWNDDEKLPERITSIYEDMIMHLAKHRSAKNYKFELDIEKIRVWVEGILHSIGKVAMEGLFEDRLAFKAHFISPQELEEACLLGILIKERKRIRLNTVHMITFLHKTFQEMCAAAYCVKLLDSDRNAFSRYLKMISKNDNVLQMEYLLRFTCGMSVEAAEIILSHLVNVMRSEANTCSDIRFGKDIPIPFILLHEAESSDEGIINAPVLHRALKPYFKTIKISLDMLTRTFEQEFMAILNSYMDHHHSEKGDDSGQKWFDGVEKVVVSYKEQVFLAPACEEDTYEAARLLSCLSNLSELKMSKGGLTGCYNLTSVFEGLVKNQFSGRFLTKFEITKANADSHQFLLFLSHLPALSDVKLDQVSIEHIQENRCYPCPYARTLKNMHCSESCLPLESILDGIVQVGRELAPQNQMDTSGIHQSANGNKCVPVETLVLANLKERNVSPKTLAKAVTYMPLLRCLDLSGTMMAADECEELFQELNESGDKRQTDNPKSMASNGSAVPMTNGFVLEELNLSNNMLEESVGSLGKACRYMPYLKVLNLKNAQLTPFQCSVLFDGFLETRRQTQLQKQSADNITSGESDTVPDLRFSLERLNLANNEIGTSVRKLSQPFLDISQLNSLDLSSAGMNPSQCEMLFESFLESGQRLQDHQHRSVSPIIENISKSLQRNLKLEELRLGSNNVGESVKTFVQAYRYMRYLRWLDLSDACMNPSHCLMLFNGFIEAGQWFEESESVIGRPTDAPSTSQIGLNIEELKLGGNDIGESVGTFVEAYKRYMSSRLICLDVRQGCMNPSHCGILFNGFLEAVQVAEQRNPQATLSKSSQNDSNVGLRIEHLDLKDNEIGDFFDKLCQAIEYMCPYPLSVLVNGLSPEQKLQIRMQVYNRSSSIGLLTPGFVYRCSKTSIK